MSIIGIIAVIFTFGIAILAHEFGHFIFAKLLGVGVETFSIGMGKKLVKIKKGETTYCLSAIPFGGYVVLKGSMSKEMEDQIEEAEKKKKEEKEETSEDEREETPEEKPREEEQKEKKKSLSEMVSEDILMLRNKPLPVKIAIYGAGVFFNFLIAVATFMLIMMIGMEEPAPKPPEIGYVAENSITAQKGIKTGDEIKHINGRPVKRFSDVYEHIGALMESEATTLTLAMSSKGKDFDVNFPLSRGSKEFQNLIENLRPPLEPYIGDVIYNRPAEKAGIQPHDYIIGINGKEITDWGQMAQIIKKSAGETLKLKIRRGDKIIHTEATPIKPNEETDEGRLGIVMGEPNTIVKKYGPAKALVESVNTSFRIMEFVAVNTAELFSRFDLKEMSQNMGGPVAIAIQSYRQARSGLTNYFYFFGAFNIMLLMLNILPLPILDGGHILFSVIEAVTRRPIPAKLLMRIYTVMLILLITLALIITYNDIVRNLWRFKFWE